MGIKIQLSDFKPFYIAFWINLRALTIVNFSYLPCIKCDFLTDLRNKMITCYTYSVRPTIPESKIVKVPMKKFDEGENEDFCEEQYFNFEDLIFGEEETF